jgi:hypothetical protein
MMARGGLEQRPCPRQPTLFRLQHPQRVEQVTLGVAVADLAVDAQRLLVVLARCFVAALLAAKGADLAQHPAFRAPIASLAAHRERQSEVATGFVHPALHPANAADGREDRPFAAPVPCAPEQLERLPEPVPGVQHPAHSLVGCRRCRQRRRALRIVEPFQPEHQGAELGASGHRAALIDDDAGGAARGRCHRRIAARDRPPAGARQVAEIERERQFPRRTARPGQGVDRLVAAEATEVGAVSRLGDAACRVAGRGQFLRGELVNAQVHAEIRLVDGIATRVARYPAAQEALVDQGLHHGEHRRRLRPRGQVEDLLGRIEREAAFEHRALRQRGPLPWRQQVPRPVDGRLQRRLSRPRTAQACQDPEAVLQAIEQLRRRQRPRMGGGEFDGQWQAV